MTNSVTVLPQQPQVHRIVLDNGIVVLAIENATADIIATRIFIRAGSQWEPREKAGLAHLVSSVITKGTQQLSSIEIAEKIESMGANLSADAATDYFLLSLKTVSGDWPEMLQLVGEILRSPSFPENEVELEQYLTIQDIRSQKEQPFTIAFDQLRRTIYQNHPYAFSVLGTEATVGELGREDLEQFHKTYFRPDNIVISIAGRVTPEEAVAQVERVLGDWQPPATNLPTLQLPLMTSQPCQLMTPQDTQQSIVMLGYLASPLKHPDYTPLKLINTYLGNGLSSRLFVELREKRGLAYDVSAFYPSRMFASAFVVYMGTAPDNTEIAIAGLRTEVERLCSTLLSADELQSAKNKLLGQYALGKQTNAQLAQIYGWYETINLGLDFDTQFQEEANAVTLAMVQDVATRYFIEPYVSLVGPSEVLDSLATSKV
jgi:predicted Zn-dependent peptidase